MAYDPVSPITPSYKNCLHCGTPLPITSDNRKRYCQKTCWPSHVRELSERESRTNCIPLPQATEAEKWRYVPDYPDYAISSLARIMRLTRANRTRMGNILKIHMPDGKYPYVALRKNGQCHTLNLHRLLALAFLGPPPTDKHYAAHWDDDKANFSLSNLRWATSSENQDDAIRNGRRKVGRQRHNARLSDEKVLAAKKRYQSGETIVAMAEEYGVYASTLGRAIRGKAWRHLAHNTIHD